MKLFLVITVCSLLIVGGGWVAQNLARQVPTQTQGTFQLEMNIEPETSDDFYTYDGFYTHQMEERLASEVNDWFRDGLIASWWPEKQKVPSFETEMRSRRHVYGTFTLEGESQEEFFEVLLTIVNDSLARQSQDYRMDLIDSHMTQEESNSSLWVLGGVFVGSALALAFYGLYAYKWSV